MRSSNNTLTLVSGELRTQNAGLSIKNPVVLNNAIVSFNNNSNNSPIYFDGPVSVAGTNVLTANQLSGVYFTGQIGGSGGLTFQGANTAFITGANPSYTGQTMLNMTGVLVVGNSQ